MTGIILSHHPPHQGAAEILNFHVILCWATKSWTSVQVMAVRILAHQWNDGALSEYIVGGMSRRNMKRENASKKVVADMFDTSSRCTARVTAHEKTNVSLISVWPMEMEGSAKSTPVT